MKNHNNFIKTYLYGGISGIVETTITYPIDYYKVMIQNKNSYSFPQFINSIKIMDFVVFIMVIFLELLALFQCVLFFGEHKQ